MSDLSSTPEGAFSNESRKPPLGAVAEVDESAAAVASVEHKKPPSALRRYGLTIVIAAFVAGVVALFVSLGTNLLLSGPRSSSDVLIQKGTVTVGNNVEKEVFYAIPYEGPPNLHLEADNHVQWDGVKLKEQKADHFTVQYTTPFQGTANLRWRAEGIRKK